MSYCVHSFYFLQDALVPDLDLFRSTSDWTWKGLSMGDLTKKLTRFAISNPIKFMALATFTVLGGVPIAGFMAYAVATIIASLIGAIVLELVLLGIGITALAFILFFVTCITVCVTSVFVSLYYSYQVANNTWSRRPFSWPSRSTHTDLQADPSLYTETSTSTEQVDESFDKTK